MAPATCGKVENPTPFGHSCQMRNLITLLFILCAAPAYSAPVPCQKKASGEGYSLLNCEGLRVLRLKGSPEARAEKMGELLRGPLTPKLVDYFSLKVAEAAGPHLGIFKPLFEISYNQVIRLLHRATPPEIAREVDAQAKGMKIDPIYLRRALSLPDAAALLNGLGALAPFRALPAAGCTSVAFQDSKKGFVYGRNLDFAGTELWDKNPLVIVAEPEAGSSELKHLIFGADGLIFGGITGANEAGITVAVQQNYTSDGGLFGVPMIFLGELVLRSARNLDEAQAVLRKYRPAAMWTLVLTDLKTGEARAVETSTRHLESRPMQAGKLVQTNHTMNASTQAEEFISVGTKMNSLSRMEHAFESLEQIGSASPLKMAEILAYQEDPQGQLIAYRDVLKALTIQTVLFTGGPGDLYVSKDLAPTASGAYVKFAFADLFKDNPSAETVDLLQTPELKRSHQREIAQAFHLYFDQHDLRGAAKLMESQQTLDARLFRAVVAYQLGDFSNAEAIADQAFRDPHYLGEPAYIRQSLQWVQLAARWKMNRREEARSLAGEIAQSAPVNRRLREICDSLGSGRDPAGYLLDLHFEFFTGDLSGRAN